MPIIDWTRNSIKLMQFSCRIQIRFYIAIRYFRISLFLILTPPLIKYLGHALFSSNLFRISVILQLLKHLVAHPQIICTALSG